MRRPGAGNLFSFSRRVFLFFATMSIGRARRSFQVDFRQVARRNNVPAMLSARLPGGPSVPADILRRLECTFSTHPVGAQLKALAL